MLLAEQINKHINKWSPKAVAEQATVKRLKKKNYNAVFVETSSPLNLSAGWTGYKHWARKNIAVQKPIKTKKDCVKTNRYKSAYTEVCWVCF